jgi:hypothetical protein
MRRILKNNNGNNHLKIGELPDIRMVAIGDLLFHEDPDEERLLNLVNRLGIEGFLKNPPIVAEDPADHRFIVLDGANRVTALIKLKFDHIPVQVVHIEDDRLTIRCWHHAVEKLGKDYFFQKIGEMPAVRIADGGRKPDGEENGEIVEESGADGYLCTLTFENGEIFSIFNTGGLLEEVEHLKKITDLYLHTPLSDRVSYTNLAHLKNNYPEFQTLFTFRTFEKEELLKVVYSGKKLPAGITRVLLPKRALGLNIQLEFLKSALTLEEKRHWLEETIHKMVLSKSIRFYQEPTFVFDE